MDRTLNTHALYSTTSYLEKGLSKTYSETDVCKEGIVRVEPLGAIIPATVPPVANLENKRFMFPLGFKHDAFKNMFMKNKFFKNDFHTHMTPTSASNKDGLSLNSKIQIRNVFSPNRKKTLIETETSTSKSKIKPIAPSNTSSQAIMDNTIQSNMTAGNYSMNNIIPYKQTNEIKINHQIHRISNTNQINRVTHSLHDKSNANKDKTYNGSSIIGNGNGKNISEIEKHQTTHEQMKHIPVERQLYSKYIDNKVGLENEQKDLNRQNTQTTLPEFDYSMKYMVWNERVKKNESLTERGTIPSDVKYTIEDMRNFCLDNRQIINYNTINIIQCNNSSNLEPKEDHLHAKNEKNECNKRCDRVGSYASCTTYTGCTHCGEEAEGNKGSCQNGMNLEINNKKGSRQGKECEYIDKRNKTFKHCNTITNTKESFLSHHGSTEFGNTQYASSAETLLGETGNVLEKRTNGHRATKDINTVDYKINELIERSTTELEFECANNLSDQSLRKGKKKTMGACFLNLNYLTCQFLVSCDKV